MKFSVQANKLAVAKELHANALKVANQNLELKRQQINQNRRVKKMATLEQVKAALALRKLMVVDRLQAMLNSQHYWVRRDGKSVGSRRGHQRHFEISGTAFFRRRTTKLRDRFADRRKNRTRHQQTVRRSDDSDPFRSSFPFGGKSSDRREAFRNREFRRRSPTRSPPPPAPTRTEPATSSSDSEEIERRAVSRRVPSTVDLLPTNLSQADTESLIEEEENEGDEESRREANRDDALIADSGADADVSLADVLNDVDSRKRAAALMNEMFDDPEFGADFSRQSMYAQAFLDLGLEPHQIRELGEERFRTVVADSDELSRDSEIQLLIDSREIRDAPGPGGIDPNVNATTACILLQTFPSQDREIKDKTVEMMDDLLSSTENDEFETFVATTIVRKKRTRKKIRRNRVFGSFIAGQLGHPRLGSLRAGFLRSVRKKLGRAIARISYRRNGRARRRRKGRRRRRKEQLQGIRQLRRGSLSKRP